METIDITADTEDGVNPTFGVDDFSGVRVTFEGEDETPAKVCTYCNEREDDVRRGECSERDLDDDGELQPHVFVDTPLSWVNSARIAADQSKDTLSVAISVGDPRGAFVMRVERMRYTDDDGNEVDELRLSVPHPDEGMPHAALTPLASPGYYRVSH